MFILLALPLLVAVAALHRYLLLCAPSNLLVRRVRASRSSIRTSAALLVLATTLLLAMHALTVAIARGAPGWLNVVTPVLAWDAIKMALLGAQVALRSITYAVSQKTTRRRRALHS
jgi:hypothetical protein